MQPTGGRRLPRALFFQGLTGWVVTGLLCIVPVVLWVRDNPLQYSFTTIFVTAGTFGKIAGLVGLVMYALNLILATRLKFLENFFGGLNRVFIAHHILGGLAIIFLALHPVLLALQELRASVRSAALLLLPNGIFPITALFDPSSDLHARVLEEWAISFGSIAFLGMVVLLVMTFFMKLPYKFWLFTHKFLGLFFFFAGLHVLFIGGDLSEGPLTTYILLMVVLGLLAFAYRTLFGKILIRKYRYFVDASTVEGDVVSIDMRPQQVPLYYKPGQFIFIRFLNAVGDGISDEWHPFSIASSPIGGGLSIKVKALGDFTKSLLQVKRGTSVEIEGAYGKFTYTNYKNTNQIWIAGGIGITPFLSMAQSLQQTQNFTIDLYYSVKSESELIGIETLTAMVNLPNSRLRVIPYDTSWYGFLTAQAIQKMSGELTSRDFFICGPPAMMKSMRKQLTDMKVPNSAIHSEEFAMS